MEGLTGVGASLALPDILQRIRTYPLHGVLLKGITITITTPVNPALNWKQTIEVSAADQPKVLQQFFESLEQLNKEAQFDALKRHIELVDSLPAVEYRSIIASELHAWLGMVPNVAKNIRDSFQEALDQSPGSLAWRRVVVSQAISRELSVDDQHRLHELFPESEPELP